MKKLKIFGIVILSLVLVLYISVILILPFSLTKLASSNKQNILNTIDSFSKSYGISVNYNDLKIITTPMLSVGAEVNGINIQLSDKKNLFKSDKAVLRLSLPDLIFKTIKISYASFYNPVVNLDIVDGKQYAIINEINKNTLLFDTKNQEDLSVQSDDATPFEFNFKIDKLLLSNYNILINDLKSSHYLSLSGDNLLLKYDGKNLSFITNAALYSDTNKNINADIDLKTYIPLIAYEEKKTNVEQEQAVFINPVELYRQYDLKSNIVAKLLIKNVDESTKIKGHVDITDTTFKIGDMVLPKSYMQLKFDGYKLSIDTNFYIAEKENAKIKGLVDYSKNPSLDMSVKAEKIYLTSILNIAKSFIKSLNIDSPISTISTSGYITANANIKTDYKKISSNGKIQLISGNISDKKTGLNMTGMKSILSLDDNNLNIQDTQATVNGTPFVVSGSISKDSVADIKIYTQNLPLAKLYSTFAPSDIKKNYSVTSGILSLNVDLKGKLEELKPIVKTDITNLVIKDRADGITITNGESQINISTDFKTYQGNISNSNLVISAPSLYVNLRNNKLNVEFNEKDITFKPADIVFNGSSTFTLKGNIKNYTKTPDIDIEGTGTILSSVLKNLAGKDISPYLDAKGSIPTKLLIAGNDKKQNIVFRMYGNQNAYLTPIVFKQTNGKTSAIQIKADISNNKITLRDTGLYTGVTDNIRQEIGGKQLVSVTGAIGLDKNTTLHSIKVSTTTTQPVSICAFDKSYLNADADITITGTLSNPKLIGVVSSSNVSIPQLLTKISKADISLNNTKFGYNLNDLNLNGSSMDIIGLGLLDYKSILTLYDVNIKSDYIDADKVMKVAESMSKVPVFAPTNPIPAKSSSQPSTPVKITSGSINIKKLKSGDIIAENINSKLLLSNDVVYLNSLNASAFDGKLSGDVSSNIVTSAMKVKVSGSGMDADKTVTSCAGMKKTIFGTLSFNADVTLKGATYTEQMKTLKGNADFNIVNGQFGTFGRFETFLKADNLASIAFLSTATGSLINKVSPHNTAEFTKLNGTVSFQNGNMSISNISSSGKNMSLYITGSVNLLNNNANMLVLGRISQDIASLLGPLAQLNPVNILKSSTATFAAVTLNIMKAINQASIPAEISKIPSLSSSQADESTSQFIVKINGNIEKPQSAVKSFKWLSPQTDINEAEKIVNPVTTVKEAVKSIPKTKEEAVNTIKEAGKNAILNFGKQFLAPTETENSQKSE